ncbi:MAG: lipoprotein, partial [Hungatella sp.]
MKYQKSKENVKIEKQRADMVMKSKNIQNTGKKRFDIMNTTDSESWLRRKGGNMMKMKKQMACLLAAVTVFSMTGCGSTFDSQEKTAEKTEQSST